MKSENTKGLPIELLRCVLSESTKLDNQKLTENGRELIERKKLSRQIKENGSLSENEHTIIQHHEAIDSKTVSYKRVPLKKRILYAFVAILLAAILVMTVSAIREPVINFFIEIYDSFVSIFVDVPEPASIKIEEKYELGYMPEGFELVEEKEWPVSCDKIYSDGKRKIRLNQKIYSKELFSEISLDNNNSIVENLQIEKTQIVCFRKINMMSVMWHDEKYMFKLTFNFIISTEECIDVVESIRRKDS